MRSNSTRSGGRARRASRQVLDHLPRLLEDPETLTQEERYAREMIESSLRLLRDDNDVGDLKLLNAAVRELRYALKVFGPYRGVKKVATFGSARTPKKSPVYRTAKRFSSRITRVRRASSGRHSIAAANASRSWVRW